MLCGSTAATLLSFLQFNSALACQSPASQEPWSIEQSLGTELAERMRITSRARNLEESERGTIPFAPGRPPADASQGHHTIRPRGDAGLPPAIIYTCSRTRKLICQPLFRGASRLGGTLCTPVPSVSYTLCILFSVSRITVSVSKSLELLSIGRGDRPIYHPPGGCSGSGTTPESH